MKMVKNITSKYELKDVAIGTVSGGCNSGLFLKLENGEEAFAKFGRLPPGTKVLCSILKKADERKRFLMLASVDSIIYRDERVA